MKFSFCLLVTAVVAATSAERGFYQPTGQSVHQSVPSSYNYYEYDSPPQKEGWLDHLLGSNRRQDLAGIFGGLFGGLAGLAGGPIFGVIIAVIVVVVIVATVAYITTVLNSSGRGLDTDDWEVDHSVWMEQLHKDFEQSWVEQ